MKRQRMPRGSKPALSLVLTIGRSASMYVQQGYAWSVHLGPFTLGIALYPEYDSYIPAPENERLPAGYRVHPVGQDAPETHCATEEEAIAAALNGSFGKPQPLVVYDLGVSDIPHLGFGGELYTRADLIVS